MPYDYWFVGSLASWALWAANREYVFRDISLGSLLPQSRRTERLEEAEFHIQGFLERGLMAYGYFDVLDRLKNLEEKLAQTEAQKTT